MDTGVISSAVVVDTIEDMIYIKFLKENNVRWIHYDSEKIGPFGKMQNNYESPMTPDY